MNTFSCWVKHRAERSFPWDRWGRPRPLIWCSACRKDRIDFGRIIHLTITTALGAAILVAIMTIGIWCR